MTSPDCTRRSSASSLTVSRPGISTSTFSGRRWSIVGARRSSEGPPGGRFGRRCCGGRKGRRAPKRGICSLSFRRWRGRQLRREPRQRLSIFRCDLRLQRVIERPAPQPGVPALAVATKVRAPAGLLAGRVDLDPVRRSDEPDQLALRTCLTAGDAGPLWDLTNAWAAAAGFRLRPGGGLAHSPPPTLLATRAAPACAGGWPKPRHEAGLMSIRQPVSFAARRAFWPPRPIASDSCASGTITVAVLSASLSSTWSTFAGPRAFATKAAGSG